ncbi:MAG: hypothetical protein RQ760_19030, partial [Sedimentisphaerales bacterium]|nr:hypothetical protein [Sedimentisphaerales bacterium]
MNYLRCVICWQVMILTSSLVAGEPQRELKLRLSWGHRSEDVTPFYIRFIAEEMEIADISGQALESADQFRDGAWMTHAGGFDVDGVELTLRYPERSVKKIKNLNSIWAYLIEHSDDDTSRRLRLDPAYRQDSRKLTVQMDREGTKGFSVTINQLLQNKVFWVPSLDIYLAAGDSPISFADHLKELSSWKGKRILDKVHKEPESAYGQYTARWEDMASPDYVNPHQPAPGHIVCLSWDSAIYKFGVDRGAGVWNDLGNPDKFRFWFDFGDLSGAITESWKGQKLADGLPVISTIFERDGVRYEVEQFAYPLNRPPLERRGDIPMVLLQKVEVTNLKKSAGEISVLVSHQRKLPVSAEPGIVPLTESDAFLFEDSASGGILFLLEGAGLGLGVSNAHHSRKRASEKNTSESMTSDVLISLSLPKNGSGEFIIKLPSPIVRPEDREKLLGLNYVKARSDTLKFWSDYVGRGAQFEVPEKAVNDLFRANLWHALRLPRRHSGQGENVKIDLPYSNFAYGQDGTPWPVNEAVYVDYMLYDLRGYHDISVEELLAIYRNNQEASGHVGGYANWVVYTPSMMYVVAKNYLLSGDRKALNRLLPQTLKALDWCLAEISRGSDQSEVSRGLVYGPLNDLTAEGAWAFGQAYIYAGLELFGRVLQQIDHPRAKECLTAAHNFRQAVARGFGAATMRSPLVQLRDHTWTPYVPCEASKSGRLLEQWYPTDVDTGAVHLLRLKALPADGVLADYLLNDHEDNLYLNGWGMANEPVYNQQATAYLLRDDPKAVIRAFYSYMTCAFSHSVLEPVEHRWAWGQYFGPPSTDGAWFELYRNMLIHELDDDTLLLLQATPRKWLEDGKTIEVERAPTNYGRLSMKINSQAALKKLLAQIDMPDRRHPQILLVRLRHPT